MKKFITLSLVLLALGAAFSSFKMANNSDAKVIVILNTASWCPACQANSDRVEQDILNTYAENEEFDVIINDLSDKSTKKAAMEELEAAGLAAFAKKNKATGYLHFINADNLELISSISVSEETDAILKEFSEALSKAKE